MGKSLKPIKHRHKEVPAIVDANAPKQWRLINRDGTINAWLPDRRRIDARDLYHSLLSLSWSGFMLFIFSAYIFINVFFALGFYFCGPDALELTTKADNMNRLLNCFFFSVQTFATIGYGKLVPNTLMANILVTIEALCGLLAIALSTGLLFARFAKPTARIVFSDQAVVNVHDGVPSLLFRIANERFNQIAAAEVQVVFSVSEITAEGEKYRTLYDLELERSSTPLFGLSWTVVHPITPKSPMHGLTSKDLFDREAEIMVSVSGVDETFMQTIYSRWSYSPNEILWDKRHVDILSRCEGRLTIDMDNFHTVEDAMPT